MDNNGKRRPDTQIVPARKKKPPSVKWELSAEDKQFLKSCNIRPE